jgi:hypothetical protein
VSYDIYALHVEPGEANAAALESVMQRDSLVEGDPLDPAKEARKRSIAGTLATSRMGYEVIEHDYAEVAEAEGISEDEARRQVRHLQVDNGELLVELDEEYAAVKVPYSSTLVECNIAEDVFKTLRVLRDEGKFVPYDPQLGRELDIESDRDAFFQSFKDGVEQARKSGTEEAVDERPRRSLWKRLLGRG